jgi:osmotically-inducible protein OsmY
MSAAARRARAGCPSGNTVAMTGKHRAAPENQHGQPVEYVQARVQDALARDARTGELAIDVKPRGAALVLAGTVATADRRKQVEVVARQAASGVEIHNELGVVDLSPPGGMEPV